MPVSVIRMSSSSDGDCFKYMLLSTTITSDVVFPNHAAYCNRVRCTFSDAFNRTGIWWLVTKYIDKNRASVKSVNIFIYYTLNGTSFYCFDGGTCHNQISSITKKWANLIFLLANAILSHIQFVWCVCVCMYDLGARSSKVMKTLRGNRRKKIENAFLLPHSMNSFYSAKWHTKWNIYIKKDDKRQTKRKRNGILWVKECTFLKWVNRFIVAIKILQAI